MRKDSHGVPFIRTKTKVYKNKNQIFEDFRHNVVVKMCLSNIFAKKSRTYRRKLGSISKKYHFQHLRHSTVQHSITENQLSVLVTCTVQDCLSKYLFLKLQAIKEHKPSKKSPVKLLSFYKHQYEGLSETVERLCYSLTSSALSFVPDSPRATHSLGNIAVDRWTQCCPTKELADLATQSSFEHPAPLHLADLATQSSFEHPALLQLADLATQSSFEAPKHLADLATQSSFEHDPVSNSLTSILTQTDFEIAEEFQPFSRTRTLLNSQKFKSLDVALGDGLIVSELLDHIPDRIGMATQILKLNSFLVSLFFAIAKISSLIVYPKL